MKYAATLSSSTVLTERQIDDVLSSSFPASDPPSWTLGGAETDSVAHSVTHGPFVTPARTVADTSHATGAAETSPARPYLGRMMALLGASGLALLLPLFVVFLPLALLYRLMLEVTGWPRWLPRMGN